VVDQKHSDATMEKVTSLDFDIKFFEAIVRDRPDYVDALIPLGEAYTKKGLHQKGLVIDERLARLKKRDPIIHYNLACSYALLEVESLDESCRDTARF